MHEIELDLDKTPLNNLSRREFLRMGGLMAGGSLLAATPLAALAQTKQTEGKKSCPHCGASGCDGRCEQPDSHLSWKDRWANLEPAAPLAVIEAKDFRPLLGGKVPGLTDKQLSEHIGLYEGYIKKYNAATQAIAQATAAADYSRIRDLQLGQSFALNGAVLHDYYFSNMGGTGLALGKTTQTLINRDFGGIDPFIASLMAVGKAMRGWVITGFNMVDGKLAHYGLDAHDVGMPASVYPVLVMDVYEHAYMIDFGTNRGAYLDAFWQTVDWTVVEERAKKAAIRFVMQQQRLHHPQEGVKIGMADWNDLLVSL